jgi:hypothetical protein
MRPAESHHISSWAVLLAQAGNMILQVRLMTVVVPRYHTIVVECLELGILPAVLEM